MRIKEIEARLTSEKFINGIFALAVSERPLDPTAATQYDAARAIVEQTNTFHQAGAGKAKNTARQRLGALLGAYVLAYGTALDCF